mgnify:CR=1 FL=1
MLINVTLHFSKGYIGHPYWTEREKVINITKECGMNRARSVDKRQKSLRAWLDAHDMTMEDFQRLEARAARPFYTRADVGHHGAGVDPDEIVVPAHHLNGMAAQACDLAPASVRLASPEQIRTVMTIHDFATGKTKPDGIWERFAVVKSGTGQALSNQRGLRTDAYIAEVTAVGTIRLINDELASKGQHFWAWAGREIGVGAARKLGWGRFEVIEWTSRNE